MAGNNFMDWLMTGGLAFTEKHGHHDQSTHGRRGGGGGDAAPTSGGGKAEWNKAGDGEYGRRVHGDRVDKRAAITTQPNGKHHVHLEQRVKIGGTLHNQQADHGDYPTRGAARAAANKYLNDPNSYTINERP